MENAGLLFEKLKGLGYEIAEMECRLDALKMEKRKLYVRYFYAKIGSEVGTPFMFKGETYYRVEGGDNCVRAYPKTRRGVLSTKGKWISCFQYNQIKPLPMENSKNDE